MKTLRALPSWMSRQEEKQKEPLKSRRKRKVAKAIFYCMNEKELVEAAVSCLNNKACVDVTAPADHQVGADARDTTVKIRVKPASLNINTKPVMEVLEEDSSDCGDALEMTCVSETDLDITEVETLPYTKSPQHQEPEGHASGPLQSHSGVMNVELKQCPQIKADAAEEDDTLQFVRDIFFT